MLVGGTGRTDIFLGKVDGRSSKLAGTYVYSSANYTYSYLQLSRIFLQAQESSTAVQEFLMHAISVIIDYNLSNLLCDHAGM